MIVQKRIYIDGKEFIRTFSDSGRYVVGGLPYGNYIESCDPAEFGRTYTEGDLIPQDEQVIRDKAEGYDILMGVKT